MTWVPNRPNLLPVDRTTGGLARFIGWVDHTATTVTTEGDGTLTLPRDEWVTTVPVAGGVALSKVVATPQRTYTCAVSADGFVAVSLLWVMEDGTVQYESTGMGSGRVAATGTAPQHSIGIVMEIAAPTVRVTATGTLQVSVAHLDRALIGSWTIGADPASGTGPVTVSSPVIVGFPTDPGPLDPYILDTTMGTRLWQALPAFMRTDDHFGVLRNYLTGIGSVEDTTAGIAADVAAGLLTDPDNAPDAWIPWLATAAGIPVKDVPSTRALLQAQALAPTVGTRAAIAALARQFLTGTRVADVYPGSSTWQIVVRVRNDELSLVVDEPGLAAAMTATGQIPAGYYLTVVSGLPTWAAIDAAMPDWSHSDAFEEWADVDSIGVTGS